jgi:hypothetical protein
MIAINYFLMQYSEGGINMVTSKKLYESEGIFLFSLGGFFSFSNFVFFFRLIDAF